MWPKYFIFTILFFVLALLEVSFFTYFNFWGANLELVFILFFVLIFFGKKNSYFDGIFWAIIAGFFSDLFSVFPFSTHIFIFLTISFLCKKIMQNLSEAKEKFPIQYFIILFLPSFLINELFLNLISYFFNYSYSFNLGWILVIKIIYNLVFSIVVFYVFKKLQSKK